MDPKQRAADLLLHYIRFGMTANGLIVDSDTRAEIEDIISFIVDPLQQQIDEMQQDIADLARGKRWDTP